MWCVDIKTFGITPLRSKYKIFVLRLRHTEAAESWRHVLGVDKTSVFRQRRRRLRERLELQYFRGDLEYWVIEIAIDRGLISQEEALTHEGLGSAVARVLRNSLAGAQHT